MVKAKSTDKNAKKILIVEDDPPIRELYEFKLKLEGFDIRSAADGALGLAAAEDFMPDLILLDLKMPIMTGEEMLKKLRSKSWGRNMRVIVLTNISRDEAPHRLRLLNVDRYIVKAHYTPQQVVDLVRNILGIKA
ncbi:MAG TPA: response regulator [Candidatus Saccharimonadales bacterium]